MEPIITKEDIKAIGIELKPEEVEAFVDRANEMLRDRIGLAIVETLDDNQLAKMKELVASGDKDALSSWLDEQVPDREMIAEDEVDILLGDLVKEHSGEKTEDEKPEEKEEPESKDEPEIQTKPETKDELEPELEPEVVKPTELEPEAEPEITT